jgi:hypothetical protein
VKFVVFGDKYWLSVYFVALVKGSTYFCTLNVSSRVSGSSFIVISKARKIIFIVYMPVLCLKKKES